MQVHVQAGIVLVTDHQQHRRGDGGELGIEIVERRPGRLHGAHGMSGAQGGMIGEVIDELLPALGILDLELDTVGRHAHPLALDRAGGLHAIRGRQGFFDEGVPRRLVSAGTARRRDYGGDPVRMAHGQHQRHVGAHGEPDRVRLLQPQMIQQVHRVGEGGLPAIGGSLARHVGRRIASGVQDDAAVAAREIAHLVFPASVVATELVQEQDRIAFAGILEIKLHAVAFGMGHVSSLLFLKVVLGCLDLAGDFGTLVALRQRQFVARLKRHPKPGAGAEKPPETKRRIG